MSTIVNNNNIFNDVNLISLKEYLSFIMCDIILYIYEIIVL